MTTHLRRAAGVMAGAIVALGSILPASAGGAPAGWSQWGQDAQHRGFVAARGQSLSRQLANLAYDPFVGQELAEGGGALNVHYQAPLLRGDDVFMMFKTGAYTPDDGVNTATHWNSQVWNERRLRVEDGRLVQRWSFASDWKPEPADMVLGWEPVFHAALAGRSVYVPGAGGTVFQLDAQSGRELRRVNPFGAIDPATYVAGPLTAGDRGDVYYNALRLNPDETTADSWLVRIDPAGRTSTTRFSDLVPNAAATCFGGFHADLPWPPSRDALPPSGPCGPQRPGLNVAPAIAADGTVYTVSRADNTEAYGFLVAAGADLGPRWAASLRDRIADGCGVLVPVAVTGAPEKGTCRNGANPGVDPQTNLLPAGRVRDLSSASPTVMPGGGVLLGVYTRYNTGRGHLFEFGRDGRFLHAADFGWDSTPAVYQRHGVSHVVLKENHYDEEFGVYCNPDPSQPVSEIVCAHTGHAVGPFYLTQLDANLAPEWRFRNTNTQSCGRSADGSLRCVSDHPNGFEWCINAAAIDADGTVYANSEDGNVYSVAQGHAGVFTEYRQRFFTSLALDAAYTPLAISGDGVVFTENDGQLFAVGGR
jgi:outer membrane protein assembly factor BamB